MKNRCSSIVPGVLPAFHAMPLVLAMSVLPMFASVQAVVMDWDPTLSGGTALGGAGPWDTIAGSWWDGSLNTQWVNGAGDTARFGGTPGTGAVVIDAGGVAAHGLVFSTGGYTLSGGVLTLNDPLATLTVPNITVTNLADTATISSVITGANGLLVDGAGTLSLGGANTFTGGTTITNGKVVATNIAALSTGDVTVSTGGTIQSMVVGTWGTNVNLNNGGTFSLNGAGQLNIAPGKTIALGTGGGTVNVGPNGLAASKILLAAGQLTGSSALTKSGPGVFQISGAQTGFSGVVNISGGTIEFQNVDSLGTAVTTINIDGATSDLASTGIAVRHNINLFNSGNISANTANADFQGTVNVGTGGGTAALRLFQTITSANSFKISGPITGAGNLTATAPAAATLTITGSRAGHTGQLVAGTNATILPTTFAAFGNTGFTLAGGTMKLPLASSTVATAGVNGLNATYFNFGSNPGILSPQFAGDQLFLTPRSFGRIDAQVNVPQAGAAGDIPIVPVPGYAIGAAAAGAVNNGTMWKGLLNITTAGSYQFKGTDDDNLVVYIDGVQIGTLGVVSALTNIGSAVNLTAGTHSIVIKHTNGGGGGYATVRYNGADTGSTDMLLGTTPGSLTTGSMTAIDLGPVTSTAGGTLEIVNDATTAALNLGNGTLNITSPTVSTLTAAGGTITAATPTISVQSGALTVTGSIGQSSTGLGLTFSGPGLAELQGANTFTGTTTVTGGQLRLNQTGAGDAVAGNLTVNSANPNGDIANVRLLQSDQIADTALLTMTSGILDVGSNTDTVGSLAMNGGRIMGTGTLTVSNLGSSTLTAGVIDPALAGGGGLNKTGSGLLVLRNSGNSFTGVTNVSAGALILAGGSLGAGGAGNETTVGVTGQLVSINSNSAAEAVSSDNNTGVRAVGGTTTLGGLAYTASATAPVLSVDGTGELILNSAPTASASITKTGNGVLTFNYNVGATLPANVIHGAGTLGFNGTQSFTTATIPAGLQYQFNSDPGATVDVTAPAGTAVIAGYAAANELLPRINGASAGALALNVDSAAALNFSADPLLSLGAVGLRTYSGTITPGASGYRLGGGGGELTVTTPLTGTNNLTVDERGTVVLRGPQAFTGTVTVDGAGKLRVINNHELGTASNGITLTNGGTLQWIANVNDGAKTGALFTQLGNSLNGQQRTITVGAGGGTLDTLAYNNRGNAFMIGGVNALTGSGDLTKKGFGEIFHVNSSDFSGNLILDAQSGAYQLRSAGSLPNVASLTVGQSAEFIINNVNAIGARQFPEASNLNRLNDAAQINLKGGTLTYFGNDAVATNELESVGKVVLDVGRNAINVNKGGGAGTVGAQLNVANLTRSIGGGVVRIGGTFGTLGTVGDHSRLVFTLINGVAPTAGQVLPWATVLDDGFAVYGGGAFVGVNAVTGTAQASGAGFAPVATTLYNFNTATASATLTLAAGNQQLDGFRFGNGNVASNALLFTAGTDKLFVGSGVIISDNNNQPRTIGSATVRGALTAGLSAAAAGAKELFFHLNQNVLGIESVITDNNGAVTVNKGTGGGTLELRAANTYSGGTVLNSGRINALQAGSLGSGPVTVKGAAIELRAAGTTSSTAGFTILDRSELYFQNNTAVYNQPGDRFTLVGEGNMLTGGVGSVGQGLNSLTRVGTITGAGQIIIPAGTHIRAQNAPNGVVDINMPINLGTNADLFFNLGTGGGLLQTITVGAGTPWKGLGSSVGTGWSQGAINANSDFTIQGLNRVGGNVAYALGATGTVGGYTINNLAGKPINAFLEGQVTMSEDTPIALPSDLTFVVTPGGYLSPNVSNQFGAADIGLTRASLLVQAGGTVDPGNFVAVGAAANQPFGMPYPIPSPVNAFATFEAGSRFLLNDASGIGSTTGGATWTMKANSLLHLGSASAFLGSNAGLINGGQFVYEPGAIIRYDADRVFKLDQFVNNEPNGKRTVLEIFNGTRNVTDAVNPFLVAAPGVATVVPLQLSFGDGGMITNDDIDRTINDRRGNFLLEDGAVLAATSQTNLNVGESIKVAPNATLYIGSSSYVDGLPKNGLVLFSNSASDSFGAGAKVVVRDGATLGFSGAHSITDTTPIDLPVAVTTLAPVGAVGFNPGNGSALLLNSNNYMEIMGALTGNGAVIGNQGTSSFAPGYGATADFTFGGVVASTNLQNPHMTKVGTTAMTLTNVSTTTGRLGVMQGELILSGANGKWRGGQMDIGKGGILTFDNTVNAVVDRQEAGGSGNRWLTTIGGGEFRLLGNATAVADVAMFGLANSAGGNVTYGGNTGGFGKVTVIPNGDLSTLRTSLTFSTIENFQTTGERNAAWLLRGSGLGGLPGTFSSTGVYTANAGNPKDGMIFVTAPNFTSLGVNFGQNGGAAAIFGSPGTPVVPTTGMLLGAVSPTATEGSFVTIDVTAGASRTGVRLLQASEYTTTLNNTLNMATGLNVNATGALNATGDTRFQVIKLNNGASLNTSGTLPNLTQPSQIILTAGGVLVPSGASATLNASNNGAGADSIIRTSGGVSAYIHAFGDLTVNGEFFSDIGLVKDGSGTATFSPGSLSNLRGRIALHEGTLNINDSLSNLRGTAINAAGFTFNHLELNGGTLNLNGNSQAFARIESGNFLTGAATEGGTLTSATPARVTLTDAGGFSGHITGAISLDKVGNSTEIFHGTNSYTGATTIRQGTIVLRADATLSGTSQIDLNYARIDIDDGHLAYVTDRINPAAVINLRGADFVNRGRAGELTQQHLGTVNLLQGNSLFQTLAGGGGATETYIANLVRSPGATTTIQQNYGFLGTAGNDTTAIRFFPTLINGTAPTLVNNILPAWMIVNNDHFATYQAGKGVSYLGNTEDGFATYDGGDLSTAGAGTGALNYNDGTNRTIPAGAMVNVIRNAPGAAQTLTLSGALTLNAGGLLTNANQAITYTGGSITSGTSELDVFVSQNTTSINSIISGSIGLVKSGSGTLTLGGANTFTGTTYVGQGAGGTSAPTGALTLNTTGANGTTVVSIPGNLVINGTTVNVNVASSIANTSNVTLNGGAILNLRDATATTETLNSLTFANAGGDANNRAIVSRANAQAASFLNLTAATPITSSNDNPISTPTISTNIGTVNFTRGASLAQTLQLDSPVTTNGLAAVALVNNANIGTVPTGVTEGGLIKAGSGLLVLGGNGTGQFGNPVANTEVFNVQSGYVRVDQPNALGPVFAITTVQSGATLLLNTGTGITGSVRLKNGSRMGATIAGSLLGAVGSTGFLDIPSGANVQIDAFDSLVPGTNGGNVTVNHLLTGSGTINQVGIEYAAGYNGGGVLDLRNVGNTFSGTINVGTNAVLSVNPNNAALSGNTLGTATINLNGGVLRVRDQANNLAGAQTITYGNNVNLNANSMIDTERLGTVATNKTIAFGTLNVAAGTQVLNTPYGTGAPITGNGYRTAFSSVDGPGDLVKGGTRYVDFNGYAGTFSGNIDVAGPQGLALSMSGNLGLNAATNNLSTLSVGGFHDFLPGKTVALGNMLDVKRNVGTITNGLNGLTTGATGGTVSLTNTSVVSADTVRNNGSIAANNSNSSLLANSFTGSGHYVAYGSDLTLNGALANDGAHATTLRVVGATSSSAVVLTASASGSTNTGGADVQSGILRIAPTSGTVTNPLGTGVIRVQGAAASVLGTGTVPVAAQNAVLEFSGTSISQAGNITNTGTVLVSSGTTTLPGIISGTAAISSNLADFQAATVPGLLEGRLTTSLSFPDTNAAAADLSATRPANPGNFGVRLEPRMTQSNVVSANPVTGWTDNTAFVYTGYFYDADGVFTFMENMDDSVMVSIDGVTRLLNNTGTNPYQTVTSTATTQGQRLTTLDATTVNTGTPQGLTAIAANPNLPAGWHTIDIRVFNGSGGAGPAVNNGFNNNYGFGLNPDGTMALDGTQASRPIDDGTGTLFRTAAAGKGNVQINAASNLLSGGITLTNNLTLASDTTGAKLQLTSTGLSDVDNVITTGTTGKATITVSNAAAQLKVNTSLTLAAGTTLKKDGPGTVKLSNSTATAGAGAAVEVTGGTLLLGATNALPATSDLNLSTGTTLASGGFSASTGMLTATDAIIDLGANASGSVLTFTDVGTWSGILSVWNYTGSPWVAGTDKLIFSANINTINLANVNFFSDGGITPYDAAGGAFIVGGNELVPVPEPSAIMSLLALFGLAGYKERRRFFHFRK